MPENLSPGLVICLALGLVAAIHAILVLALTRGAGRQQIELLGRAVGAARDPWKAERDSIGELRRRVSELSAEELSAPASPTGDPSHE